MEQTFCSLLFDAVRARAWNRWPDPTLGPQLETGGMVFPSNPMRDWVVPGTESQLFFWRHALIQRLIVGAFLNFEDVSRWRAMETDLLEYFGRFLRETSDLPAFLWVTPCMALIGRTLARNGTTSDDQLTSQPSPIQRPKLAFDFDHAYEVNLRCPLFRLFADPTDSEERPRFHLVRRQRCLVRAGEAPRTYAVEQLLYRAGPREHARWLTRAWIPANAEFYESDDRQGRENTGWLRTPHVTLVKLEPRGSLADRTRAWAWYLAFRFHRADARPTSLIWGREDFASFVGHHPALRRLLEKSIPAEGAHDSRISLTGDRPWRP